MGALSLDIEIVPSRAPAGGEVTLKVRAAAAGIACVRVSVVGYGIDETLERAGEEWILAAAVPWQASPGDYRIEATAQDTAGQGLAAGYTSFTVTA